MKMQAMAATVQRVEKLQKEGRHVSHEMLKVVFSDPVLRVFGVGKAPHDCEIHVKWHEGHSVLKGKKMPEYMVGVDNDFTNWKSFSSKEEAIAAAGEIRESVRKKFKLELPIFVEGKPHKI